MELSSMESSGKEYNTCMFIRIADNGRYRAFNTTMDNTHLLNKDVYSKTLEIALKLRIYLQTPGNEPRRTVTDKGNSGLYFFQRVNNPEANGEVKTKHQGKHECFQCGKKDH